MYNNTSEKWQSYLFEYRNCYSNTLDLKKHIKLWNVSKGCCVFVPHSEALCMHNREDMLQLEAPKTHHLTRRMNSVSIENITHQCEFVFRSQFRLIMITVRTHSMHIYILLLLCSICTPEFSVYRFRLLIISKIKQILMGINVVRLHHSSQFRHHQWKVETNFRNEWTDRCPWSWTETNNDIFPQNRCGNCVFCSYALNTPKTLLILVNNINNNEIIKTLP